MTEIGRNTQESFTTFMWEIMNFETKLTQYPNGIRSPCMRHQNDYYIKLSKATAGKMSVCIIKARSGYSNPFCNIRLVQSKTPVRNQPNYSYTFKILDQPNTSNPQGLCIDEEPFFQLKNVFFPNGTLEVVCTFSTNQEMLEKLFKVFPFNVRELATQTEISVGVSSSKFTDTVKLLSGQFESIANLSENLEQLYLNGRFSDITMKVQDKNFKVHKSILAARSPVFASMFEHEMSEKSTGIVTINDCDSSTLEELLLFVYTGTVDHVTSENSISLYKMSDKYELQELKGDCTRRLVNVMSVDTFFDIIRLAALYDDTELLESSTDCFNNNAKKIISSPNWMSFIKECPELVTELYMKLIDYKKI